MGKEQCGTCRFWEPDTERWDTEKGEVPEEGDCHRYPPTPGVAVDRFPRLDMDDWCGEWKAKGDVAAAGPDPAVLALSVDVLAHDLNGLAQSVLEWNDCKTLGDVVRLSGDDFLRTRNCGPVTTNVIRRALAKHGLKLSGDA